MSLKLSDTLYFGAQHGLSGAPRAPGVFRRIIPAFVTECATTTVHVMYTLPEADSAGGTCTRTLSPTFVHARYARVVHVATHTDGPRALCCARGHDNSAEKPRNICSAAINSETAPTFLANLHKTVTYHSIIRPIRPCRSLTPACRIPPPVHPALPPFPGSLFLPLRSLPLRRQVVRIVFYLPFFFRALHFPQFPTNPLDVTGMRGRKRTLCDRVT